jgi:serine acetyltransferase
MVFLTRSFLMYVVFNSASLASQAMQPQQPYGQTMKREPAYEMDIEARGHGGTVTGHIGVGTHAVVGANSAVTGHIGVGTHAAVGAKSAVVGHIGVGTHAVAGAVTGHIGVGTHAVVGANSAVTGHIGVGTKTVVGRAVGHHQPGQKHDKQRRDNEDFWVRRFVSREF